MIYFDDLFDKYFVAVAKLLFVEVCFFESPNEW